MADNPYAARPAGSSAGRKNECPPDMPRGDSEADKLARRRYWITRGNAYLEEIGKGHLHWVCNDGYYTIEDRY
jgi:hypothetical protein